MRVIELMEEKKKYKKRLDEIEELIQEGIEKERDRGKIKIDCEYCDGTGHVIRGGADSLTDPPEEVTCDECDGLGYVYMRLYQNRIQYYESGD